MKKNPTMIIVALSAIVSLAGCAGKVGRANYYTLNLPSPPDPPVAENAHTTVAIREFRAPSYLRQGAIVYKPSPEQIGFYAYHRWAVDPCDFVTDSIIDRLGATGTFSHVKRYDGQPDADYVVSGRLEKLEEIDYEGGVKVEVAVSAQMTRLDTGTIVWSKAMEGEGWDCAQIGTAAMIASAAANNGCARRVPREGRQRLHRAAAASLSAEHATRRGVPLTFRRPGRSGRRA
jgi:ABC-type uncharacterized transport system auxiliary subunit